MDIYQDVNYSVIVGKTKFDKRNFLRVAFLQVINWHKKYGPSTHQSLFKAYNCAVEKLQHEIRIREIHRR